MTTEPTSLQHPVDWRDQRRRLSQLVWGRVTGLQDQYCPDQKPEAKAALAQLRRHATADGNRPLGIDAFAVDAHTQVPAELYPLASNGKERRFGDEPTEAEIAVRSAMTLYAIHQQSRRERMHTDSSPGRSLARLAWASDGAHKSVRRRFAALVTADSYPELSHHLRTMIRMLRDQQVGLDYGRLAGDLFAWQYRTNRDGVRLAWSRDFENNIAPRKNTEGDPTA